MIDFKLLKQEVSIQDVLSYYHIDTALCPFCKTPGSFKVSEEKNAFMCHSCKAKGNILDFVQQREKLPHVKAAAEFIAEKIRGNHDAGASKPIETHNKEIKVSISGEKLEYNYREIARIVITIGIEQ
jgi:DNA primase